MRKKKKKQRHKKEEEEEEEEKEEKEKKEAILGAVWTIDRSLPGISLMNEPQKVTFFTGSDSWLVCSFTVLVWTRCIQVELFCLSGGVISYIQALKK